MQKHLQRLLLLVAMMVVPWVTQGQLLNYSCTFEDVNDTAGWVFVNGTQTNKWFIGSATSNGGTNSLYISNDNGTSNAYTNSSVSFVYAYREFTLGAGGYTISYDWKCYGESNYDYIRVFLAPATFDPTAGQDPTGGTSAYSWSSASLPAGFISLCGANKLNQESNWQNFYQDFNVLTAGTYRLVFAWANDGSGGTTPPGAIDNIQFVQPACPRPANLVFSNIHTTSVDVHWTETGTATSWVVEYDTMAFVPGTTGNAITVNEDSLSLTGLEVGHTYYFAIHSDCGGGDTSINITGYVTLPSAEPVEDFPWTCNFTGASALGWEFINGLQTNKWYIGGAVGRDGTGDSALYISSNNGASNTYSITETSNVYVARMMNLDAGQYGVQFDYRVYGESCCDYMYAFLMPADQELNAGTLTTSGSGWIDLLGGRVNLVSSWTTQQSVVMIPNNGSYKLVFLWHNDPSVGTDPPAAVDNIIVTPIHCPQPTGLHCDTGVDSLSFSWTAGGTETTWLCVLNGDTTEVTTTSIVYGDLHPASAYNFCVAAICEDTSFFTCGTYRTECPEFITLPYTENFESYSVSSSSRPDCWVVGGYSNYPYIQSYGGSNALYGYAYNSSGDATRLYMSLPPVDTLVNPINGLQLYFDAMRATSSTGNSYTFNIIVGVCGNPGDMSTFVPVDTVENILYNNNTMTSYEVNLSNYSDTGRYVTLVVYPAYSSSYSYCYVAIDNIILANTPTCQRVIDYHTTGFTEDSVYLAWSDTNASASNWYVEYGPTGFNHGDDDATTVYVSDTTAAIGGLTPDTWYDFYVAADCGSDDTSLWRLQTVHTACVPVDSLPYVYGFESGFNSCWVKYSSYSTSYPQISSIACSGSSSLYMYNYAYNGAHVYVAMPLFNHQLDSLQVKFRLRRNSSSSYNYYSFGLKVGVMTDPYDMNTFEPIETYTATSNTDWDTFTCYLSRYTGTGRYIAFMDAGNSTEYYTYVLLDDVEVDYAPLCGPVEDVDVNVTPYSALLTWSPSPMGEYNGAIAGVYDTALMVWTYDTVYGTSATFTGLNPETFYQYSVTNLCSDGEGAPVYGDFHTGILRCGTMVAGTADTTIVGTGTSQTSGVPVNSSWGNTMCQSIYTAAELHTLGLDSGSINGMDYSWTANSSYAKEFTIIIGTTSQSQYSGTAPINPATHVMVYHGNHPLGTSGLVHYNFDATFHWNGTDNLVVTTFMNQPTGESHSISSFYGLSTDCGTTRTAYGYQDGSQYTISTYGAGNRYTSTYRPSVTFYTGICESMETCVAPRPIVTAATSSSATVQWAPGNTESSWSVYYALRGSSNFTYAGNATTNEFTVNGLLQGTNYDFMVVALCGDDSNSAVCEGTTECAMISSFPFFENFNVWPTNTVPNCWNRDGSYSSYPYVSTSYDATGSGKSVYFYLYNNGTNYCRLTMPEVDTTVMPIRNLQLFFQAMQSYDGYINDIEIGVMTDPYNVNTFRPVDTISLAGRPTTEWTGFEVPLNNYNLVGDTGTFITFRSLTTSGTTYFYLDDVTLEQIPTCQRPDSLVLDAVTTTSFTCHWHDRAGANEWIVEWGPRGFTPGTGTMVNVTSNPATINGVPSSYNGDFYVYAMCSVSDTSPASRYSCPFNTMQVPATLPYTYNFEDSVEWDNWQTNSNHATSNWARGTAMSYNSNYGMYVSNDGGATFGTDNNAIVNTAVYRDIDFGTVDSSYEMTFRYWVGGDNAGRYDGLMVFLVDPNAPVIASNAAITSPWGNVNDLYRIADARRDTNWREYHAIFDTISGVHRVAFFWFNQSRASYFEWGPAAIDDIHIDYSPCPRPLNLDTLTVGSTTAHLTWSGASSASYRVCYRVVGADPSTNTYVNCNTNQIVLTGLTPMTSYRAWVQKICGSDSSLFSDGCTFQTEMCDNPTYAQNYDSTASMSTTTYFPGYATYNYSFSEVIIDSADLAAGGLVAGQDITAFMYNPTNTNANTYHTNCDIYMGHTTLTDLNSGFIHIDSTFVQVADNMDLSFDNVGWQIRGFDVPFTWDGHSNVVFAVNRQHGSWTSGTSFESHYGRSGQGRYVYNDGGAYDPTTVSDGYATDNIGNYRFISCGAPIHCGTPVITSVTQDYHSGTITWTGDGTNYEVNIKETSALDWPATDIAVTGNTYTFTGLIPETSYTFRVRQDCSADSAGYSEWVIDAFTTDNLPCFAPESLAVSDLTNAQGTFSWTAVGNESMWDLHVWNPGGLDSVYRVTTNPVTVGGFTAGVTYNAAIRAICGVENYEGEYGSTITFTTLTCPDVTGLTTSNVTYNSVTLNWTADPMAEGWMIEYGYTGFAQGTGTNVTVHENSYVVNGLEDETPYDFYVKAICGDSWNSEGWTRVSATTQTADNPTYTVTVTVNDASMGTATGGGTYQAGQSCTVTATANSGYRFVNWSNGETANPYTFTVVSNITLTANFESVQGIEEVSGDAVCTIYPNPTSDVTTISVSGVNGKVRIAVVDMNGRTVASETLECSSDCEKTMDVDQLAQGAYFVRITGDNVNMVKKLVVR